MNLKSLPEKIKKLWFFFSEDMWRILPSEVSKGRQRGYNVIKVIALAIKRYKEDNLQRNASALTYSTFLSVIPLLAVILSIAKGFGFENIVQSQLFEYFPGPRNVLEKIFDFTNSYMQHTKDGVFLGIGLVLLLYTVFNLISNIENIFNMVWQIPKGRSFSRRFLDYFSIFLILPLLLVCSSGISIFLATTLETIKEYVLLAPVYEVIISIIPFIVSILLFTGLYMYMPNTKVLFRHAFIAAVFAGVGFQIFQYIYISGQIWVSKYNAIYGSFAFIPLLLLWMQLSWVLCLVGAEIAYAGQNIQNYDFEQDSKNISRRYLDFLTLSILALIVKRFEKGEKPYGTAEISNEHKIPIRLAQNILYNLVNIEILIEVKDKDNYTNYLPAIDINLITVNYLFTKIDRYGSENFKVDNKFEFSEEWKVILESRNNMFPKDSNLIVKDLEIK
jgi:Predicted membrane protein